MYTDFMRGQRQVHCLSCLLEFGCLTASHHCPFCTRAFEYRPQQWQQTLHCPNDKQKGVRKACGLPFSIAVFHISAAKAAEEAGRQKEAEAARRKREECKEARAKRGGLAARYGDDDDDNDDDAELGAFIVSEDCPRCGKQFSSGHAAHLSKCKGKKGSGGAVAKRKRASDASWLVGSYDEGDRLYRQPKQAKKGSRSEKPKAKSAK